MLSIISGVGAPPTEQRILLAKPRQQFGGKVVV